MTRKEIIDGLKFTIDMFLFDPATGKTYTEPRNDMDKTTIDACKGAIELLEERPNGKWLSYSTGLVFKRKWGRCSECGNTLDFDGVNAGRGDANFCPNCGADMRGADMRGEHDE